jgi:hypothetical protein
MKGHSGNAGGRPKDERVLLHRAGINNNQQPTINLILRRGTCWDYFVEVFTGDLSSADILQGVSFLATSQWSIIGARGHTKRHIFVTI